MTIMGFDYLEKGCTSGSLLVDQYFINPIKDLNEDYVSYVINLCELHSIDLLISVVDDEMLLISQNRNRINAKIVMPSHELMMLFRDKLEATLAMQEIGIPTPRIINDLSSATKVIFRDKISAGSRGIYTVDLSSAQYIENRFKPSVFIQEFIEGTEYTVDVFADAEGVPKVIIPRVRISTLNGMSFICRTENKPVMIDLCKLIYSTYKIPGLSNVQFIEKDGLEYFIELNPRIAGTAIASILSSFNYVELFIEHFLKNKSLESLDSYMQYVAWGSIISRFYDELIWKN